MNVDQIKILRESYNVEAERPDGRKSTLGEYIRFITDCNLEFVTSKDLVLCDDTNSMVHCVCVNEDPYTQASFPAKIISAAYEDVHAIESIMSRENFEKFLESGYFNNIEGWSDAKKEFMLKWIQGVRIQAQQPVRPTPFYTEQAGVISMPSMPMKREDGIEKMYLNTQPSRRVPGEEGNESTENATEEAVVVDDTATDETVAE